ncbi:MAG TPA: hypothetical protein VKT27_13035 [Candidatus Binataceae bacterium]|nr:hypothetical protein [Candidatus Binataceae bacterium]
MKKTDSATQTDEKRLRSAVSLRRLTIVISHTNIRETLAAVPSYPDIARAQIGLMLSLVDWNRLVRLSPEILEDDIRHFAFNGEAANSPFVRDTTHVRSILQRIIDGRIAGEELEAVIQEDREQKRTFLGRVRKVRAEMRRALATLKKAGEIPTFEQFFEDGAEEHLRAFIRSFRVAEECERRGLDKLLRIPSIRAMIGLGMSFIYRTAVEGKAPRRSDLRDLQHAPAAAAVADIFVTRDEEFALMLGRVPIKGFRVMGLHKLLADTEGLAGPAD